MSSRALAVVTWELGPDTVVGRAVFLPRVEAARKTASAVVAALKEELALQDEWPREVESPVLVRRVVEVRPTLSAPKPRKVKGRLVKVATPDPVALAVDVVHGRVGEDLYLCEILQFEHVFWLRDPARLPALVDRFVRDAAAREPVDALFARTLWGPAALHTATVRVPDRPRPTPPSREVLSGLAEAVTGPPPGTPGPWERRAEVDAVSSALTRRRSVLVVGPPRSGRSAVLYEAVRRARRTPPVWRTHAERLVAGTRWLGEWQERCDALVAEVTEAGAVLWIEDAVRLFHLGGGSPEESVGAWLTAAMADGLPLLVELTPKEVELVRAWWPAFLEGLEAVELSPLSEAATTELATLLCAHHEHHHGVRVAAPAWRLARRLLDRFARDEGMPGALVRFVGDCVGEARRTDATDVDEAAVLEAFGRRTGMPRALVDDRVPLDPGAVRAWLGARVLGQPQAVDAVTDVLVRFKAGLENPRRPVATVLLAGPTGVGKTATARAVAEWAFGTDRALVRVDMSECQDPGRVARLVGTSDGEPGELVRRVRERPFSVVLLDEVEKAHPVFFDVLLGLLDEGTMTDATGRVTSFRGCVVLLTTNLGTPSASSLGFADGEPTALDRGALRRFFRPEFLNRIDRVVPYGGLSRDIVRDIALRELAALEERPGFASRRLRVVCSDEVLERMVRAGFDPAAGARPLQRAIEQGVVAAVARYLLRHPELVDAVLTVEILAGDWVVR